MNKKSKFLLTICSVAALCAGAVAFSACGDDNTVDGTKPHEHVMENDYTVTQKATCIQKGLKVKKCLIKGCTYQETLEIEMTPHKLGPEKNTATCTEPGAMVRACTTEGCTYQEVGEATEARGHSMTTVATLQEATCYQEGLCNKKCTRCGAEENGVVLAKTEHRWVLNSQKSYDATCLDDGLEVYNCITPGCTIAPEEIKIEALGHLPQYTSFEYPTFDHPGSCEGKCARCGEDLGKPMPQLTEGAEVEFEFRVERVTGRRLTAFSMDLTVLDWEGKEVVKANAEDMWHGVLYKNLPVYKGKQYTMKVSGIAGFEDGEVKINPEHPVGEVNLECNGIFGADDENVPAKLGEGNRAQEIIAKDIDGNSIVLSEILRENKIVVLHFFYTTCHWCSVEYPGFIRAYNNYKDQGVAVIGIAPTCWDSNDVESLRAEIAQYDITFPIIQDTGETGKYIFERYNGISGAPSSVFLDHEGVIFKIQKGYFTLNAQADQTGAYTDKAYGNVYEEYLKDEWPDMQAKSVTACLMNAEYLPSKREEI